MFHHTTLENGLTVIAEPMPTARSLALGVYLRVGARDETPAQNGLCHFLEHLCFKGFGSLDAAGLNDAFDALGCRVDAFTTQELTAYHTAALPETQSALTALLLGMMRPALREADVDVERAVILEEIEMYQDDPGSVVFEAGTRHFYGAHPCARSVLGTPSSLEGIGARAIQGFLEGWYAPNRLVLVACGALDWEALRRDAERLTRDWHPSGVTRAHPPLVPGTGRRNLARDVTRAQAAIFTPGFAVQNPRHLAAGVLAQIIGESNSRLYWALVDDGLCDEASFEHSAEDGLGSFYGSLRCDPQNLEGALERFETVLREVQERGITETELARTKKKLEVSLALRFETPQARLGSLAEDFIALGAYRSVNDLLAEVRGVQLADIEAVLETQPFADPCITTLSPG